MSNAFPSSLFCFLNKRLRVFNERFAKIFVYPKSE